LLVIKNKIFSNDLKWIQEERKAQGREGLNLTKEFSHPLDLSLQPFPLIQISLYLQNELTKMDHKLIIYKKKMNCMIDI
jgi:hypothetical protein